MSSPQVLEGCEESTESSLLQAEQAQLLQSISTGEVLQLSENLHGPPLDQLQHLHTLYQSTAQIPILLLVKH